MYGKTFSGGLSFAALVVYVMSTACNIVHLRENKSYEREDEYNNKNMQKENEILEEEIKKLSKMSIIIQKKVLKKLQELLKKTQRKKKKPKISIKKREM